MLTQAELQGILDQFGSRRALLLERLEKIDDKTAKRLARQFAKDQAAVAKGAKISAKATPTAPVSQGTTPLHTRRRAGTPKVVSKKKLERATDLLATLSKEDLERISKLL